MKLCEICGDPIPADKTSNNLKYCKPKCARQAESRQNTKAIAYRAARINAVAQAVYSAYECKCAICKWQATTEVISVRGRLQYAKGNEIHHITPVRESGADATGNLILLCPNHHKQADLGLIARNELKKYTKEIELTKQQRQEARNRAADLIATLIF